MRSVGLAPWLAWLWRLGAWTRGHLAYVSDNDCGGTATTQESITVALLEMCRVDFEERKGEVVAMFMEASTH